MLENVIIRKEKSKTKKRGRLGNRYGKGVGGGGGGGENQPLYNNNTKAADLFGV